MSKPRILIVDDDGQALRLAKKFLVQQDFDVTTTTDPAVAIREIQHGTFSAAIVDLRLCSDSDPTDFSGLDLAQRISDITALPILILTVHDTYESASQALKAQSHGRRLVAELVRKQDGLEKLLECLENVLRPNKVFLSYVREDGKRVQRLYKRLQQAGFQPWMDTYNLLSGEKWERAIAHAIADSDFCVICISKHSEDKPGYYREEVRRAISLARQKPDHHIFLIPVRLDETVIKTDELLDFQWIDFYEPKAFEKLLQALRAGGQRRRHPR